eukprot:288770_1
MSSFALVLLYLIYYNIPTIYCIETPSISQHVNEICTTLNYPNWTQSSSHPIEKYLWNKILFKIISPNHQIIRPVITIKSNDMEYALSYDFEYIPNSVYLLTTKRNTAGGTPFSISNNITNVNQTTVMWTSWQLNIYNISVSRTYLRGGVGTQFDKHSSKYLRNSAFEPKDIQSAEFYEYKEISDTKWEFYHNLCNLQTNIFTSFENNKPNTIFAINDYIRFHTKITDGNKINIPIHITSQDIININHTLYINDSNNCMICNTDLCTDGKIGI